MFVDTGLLHSGTNVSHLASDHAHVGADHLARAPLLSGMFGDFAVAEAFHDAIGAACARHARSLQAHRETLAAIASKAHMAAAEFTDMDDRNATRLQAVQCGSNT
ncbi:DUF2563 family protein [Mycobacterium haemophilum]|uniref:DUF2563 domain-containing protein n=1 Tax=Mycobacterium haemophilum TaxID=29311 RepID=A0A0I9TBA6_9MYCO|nr:DUF2563 family protein [Mycobacterium haemophilum]KLO26669.1 hypothetical protein ABH39_17330 [Mycobacterium haemophilum]KLO34789.1 hypothetical protein ABH38_17790 [Mycobacterium haemophilum]KLO39721.1 hypothetical protein ABH37_17610 [Mycobacterium haemophilum]KLO46840.1 hypothetical protein ABH36_17720 [Mycobacterium haemophilum]